MTTRLIHPALLAGSWPAMPSKSMAHRVLLASLLTPESTSIICPLQSVDMTVTADVVARLGACVKVSSRGWDVSGLACRPDTHPTVLNLYPHESGTTLRYGMSVVASLGVPAFWHCAPGLQKRPLSPLDDTLRTLGVTVERSVDGWKVGAWPEASEARTVSISGAVSSQFIGGLMMALGAREGCHRLAVIPPFESQPYIAMTLDVMRTFGVSVHQRDTFTFDIEGHFPWTSPGTITIEGDWSNSALAFVVGCIQRQGALLITGLDRASHQGDRAIVEMLTRMQARIHALPEGFRVEASPLKGATFDCTDTPDLVPVLAVACACAKGTSVIKGARRLQLKESNRLVTVADLLTRLGVGVTLTDDGMVIEGKGFHDETQSFVPTTSAFESYGDHRLVMALLATSTRLAHPVTLSGSEAITKSYPHLWDDWTRLGGECPLSQDVVTTSR